MFWLILIVAANGYKQMSVTMVKVDSYYGIEQCTYAGNAAKNNTVDRDKELNFICVPASVGEKIE